MKASKDTTMNGVELVGLYQQAVLSVATMQAAKHSAEDSEQVVLSTLTAQSGGTILMPQAIPDNSREQLTHASIDAHIKKIQALQMESLGTAQITQLQIEAQKNYQNKKVTITVLDAKEKPVEVVWFDQKSGYRASPSSKRKLTGIISEVHLNENILIIRPTYFAKLLNPKLDGYAIAIISPATLSPMVNIS